MSTVLITGASGAIGGELARSFAREGYRVAMHYNSDEAQASELYRELAQGGAQCALFKADLSDASAPRTLYARVRAEFGHVDLLVNNAGASLTGLLCEQSDAEIAHLITVDLISCILLAKYFSSDMISRKAGGIINISSVWGLCGASCEAAYSAAKAGLIGFTKAYAQELGSSGIRVNCVCPGVIDTPMNSHLSPCELQELAEETPLCRLGTPQDVSGAVLFLASNAADFVTGAVLNISGGFVL